MPDVMTVKEEPVEPKEEPADLKEEPTELKEKLKEEPLELKEEPLEPKEELKEEPAEPPAVKNPTSPVQTSVDPNLPPLVDLNLLPEIQVVANLPPDVQKNIKRLLLELLQVMCGEPAAAREEPATTPAPQPSSTRKRTYPQDPSKSLPNLSTTTDVQGEMKRPRKIYHLTRPRNPENANTIFRIPTINDGILLMPPSTKTEMEKLKDIERLVIRQELAYLKKENEKLTGQVSLFAGQVSLFRQLFSNEEKLKSVAKAMGMFRDMPIDDKKKN